MREILFRSSFNTIRTKQNKNSFLYLYIPEKYVFMSLLYIILFTFVKHVLLSFPNLQRVEISLGDL